MTSKSLLSRSFSRPVVVVFLLAGAGVFALVAIFSIHLRYFLFEEPVPFTSVGEWGGFLVTAAVLGALLGVTSALAASLPASSWWRAWTAGSSLSTLIAIPVMAHSFGTLTLPIWLLVVLLSGALGGALLAPFYRWGNKVAADCTV
jgi:hypothetical protein